MATIASVPSTVFSLRAPSGTQVIRVPHTP
jgi:hypothetical protein